MGTYILRRLLLMIPTLIGITFLVFMMVALAPGGIGAAVLAQGGAMHSQGSVAQTKAALEDRYGLDDSPVVQYGRWLSRISPLQFGRRDQLSPSGDRVRMPRSLKEPPLWEWFESALPASPGPSRKGGVDGLSPTLLIERYKRDARRESEARAKYVDTLAQLRQELGHYAKEKGIRGGVDGEGRGVARVIRAHNPLPDRSAKSWPEIERLSKQAITDYSAALATRADLEEAFAAKPYPEAGIPLIPGVISVSWPDFGSTYSSSQPVLGMILEALPVTLLLNLIAFPIIYLIAIPSGMAAATKRGSWLDVGLGATYIALWSFPVVLAGVLGIGFLASNDYLGAFPVSGLHDDASGAMRFLPGTGAGGRYERGYLLDALWHICLPVMCLVYPGFAILSKQCRAAMLENFSADYVRTAKAKGVSSKDVVLRHVFRNSLLPLITMFVTIFPAMLSGSVVIEKIFSVPGMGSLILRSIADRDRELLLANTLMIAAVNLLALLLQDILYALADPRVAYD